MSVPSSRPDVFNGMKLNTRHLLPAGILLAGISFAHGSQAAIIQLVPTDSLQQAIEQAQAGDVLRLAAGEYRGNVVIDKPLTLEGPADRSAVVVGARKGRTVWVQSPDVVVRSLTVTQSGLSLPDMDAGVFLDKTATKALIENNDILNNSVGVYVWGAHEALVQNNRIVGTTELRVSERGNGVTLWNAPGAKIIGNDISLGRDGIFSNTSKDNEFRGNHFSELRYGVHYMYTNDSVVSENVSIGNSIGYAIMFSERLKVKDNIAIDSRSQGIMMNYANGSDISGNLVINAEKCVYFYNANNNVINSNHFEECQIGIHYTGAAQGNKISNNAFVSNQNQVKYVGSRYYDWSVDGRGNFWSDNSAFDLDGDGIADTAYRPNDVIDQVIWRAPVARLLLNSPAVGVVRWAQSQFPAILPGGVIDSAPVMKMPTTPALKKYKEMQ